jgi:hypothetical protein
VCGCDHHTYSNECEAHSRGVSIARDDACTEVDCDAIGGRVVTGTGPGPMCPQGTVSAGEVRFTSGQVPIEGALCCITP